MSGVMIAVGGCITCGRMISFNPNLVPSTSVVTGQREPICRYCIEEMNRMRAEAGLAPFEILEGAYDPEPCA